MASQTHTGIVLWERADADSSTNMSSIDRGLVDAARLVACWTAHCGNDQESTGEPEALEELVHSAGASSSLLGEALAAAAALPKKS